MSISTRIINKREELKLTQTELANKAGLKPPAISQYESGSRSPSYEALLKLSNALGVTTDFLISGNEYAGNSTHEKNAMVLAKIISEMSIENRARLLDYATFLVNETYQSSTIPVFDNPIEYSDYLFKFYNKCSLPIDLNQLASELKISIYQDEGLSDYEALLIKGNNQYVAILNSKNDTTNRYRFTLAMLIGHAIIPWHIKTNYYIRKHGTSTMQSEEHDTIEAQRFAAHLLMPRTLFLNDIDTTKLSIKYVKDLADNKYKVSVFSFIKQMVEYEKQKYAMITSSTNGLIISEKSDCNRVLLPSVNTSSTSYTFKTNPVCHEDIRDGEEPASYWFSDTKENEMVYVSSIHNPIFENVISLIIYKNP